MRPRLVTLVAVVIAVASIALALIGLIRFSSAKSPAVDASLPTAPASYLGVYAAGPPQRYGPVARFTTTIGKQPNLVGYYSGWPEQFATSFAETVHQRDAVPLVQMDPTDASVAAIAAGEYDDYLRSFARGAREFGHAVVIGFGHEMNASWYSWGYRHVKASTFVAAWRHIVSLFRTQGADNVTWLWTINQDLKSTGPLVSWWPGARYVTWVGIDGYYYRPSDTFASVFGRTIAQVRAFTRKPVLLSETAAGAGADQAAKVRDLFMGMHEYQVLGLVWFDIAQHQGIYHQDWRVEGHPAAETAFRLAASTLTLTRP